MGGWMWCSLGGINICLSEVGSEFRLSDFNAVSGSDGVGCEMSVVGSWFLQQEQPRFQRISRAWYQKSNPYYWAWYSDLGNAAKKNDYILCGTHWRIRHDCKVYRCRVLWYQPLMSWLPSGFPSNLLDGQVHSTLSCSTWTDWEKE